MSAAPPRPRTPEAWAKWMGEYRPPMTWSRNDFFQCIRNRWGPELDGPRSLALWGIFDQARRVYGATPSHSEVATTSKLRDSVADGTPETREP